MKVLVTGAGGMLGQDLVGRLGAVPGLEVTAATRADLDVTSTSACRQGVDGFDAVVNAAAWTAVDDAESHEGEAFLLNAVAPSLLGAACRSAGARLVHVSTDYVFRGDATTPYDEDAPLAPRTAYGRTKAAGEWAARAAHEDVLVVRTAWLYGAAGRSFVRTMARLATERDTVDVVDDQRGQPTWTRDLADFVGALLVHDAAPGVYHGTSTGETTWFGLARAVFEELGHDPERVRPTTSERFVQPAPRPPYSVLGHRRTEQQGLPLLPGWRESVAAFVPEHLGAPA